MIRRCVPVDDRAHRGDLIDGPALRTPNRSGACLRTILPEQSAWLVFLPVAVFLCFVGSSWVR